MTTMVFQLGQNVPAKANPFVGGPLFVMLLVLGGIVLLITLMIMGGRKRRAAIEAKLTEIGLRPVVNPTKEQKQSAMPLSPALGKFLRSGAKNVNWYAEGTLPGVSGFARDLPVRLIEHSYTIHTGKSNHTVYHTAAVVDAPGAWPAVTLTPETMFSKIGKALGMKDIEVEDPAFNKMWKVASTDENFALALLTPEVQKSLIASVKALGSENWVAGQGVFSLVLARQLKPEAIPLMLERMASVVASLDSVLVEQMGQQIESGG